MRTHDPRLCASDIFRRCALNFKRSCNTLLLQQHFMRLGNSGCCQNDSGQWLPRSSQSSSSLMFAVSGSVTSTSMPTDHRFACQSVSVHSYWLSGHSRASARTHSLTGRWSSKCRLLTVGAHSLEQRRASVMPTLRRRRWNVLRWRQAADKEWTRVTNGNWSCMSWQASAAGEDAGKCAVLRVACKFVLSLLHGC